MPNDPIADMADGTGVIMMASMSAPPTLTWSERGGYVIDMPVVSTFFGITIRMYYREHGVPHFHAEHQGQQATFTFDGEVLAGSVRSRTATRLIRDWALAHNEELEANWNKARAGEPLESIAPLD